MSIPRGRDWERYARADVITPNIRELAEATGRAADDYPGLCAGGADLLQRHSFGRILLTRSEKGMTILQKRAAPREIKANAREVADVSGAGDTVIAVAGACMAGGMPFEEAAKMANLAAGIVVGKAGTSTVELGGIAQCLAGGKHARRGPACAPQPQIYYSEGRTVSAGEHRPEYLRLSQAERERLANEKQAENMDRV